MDTGGFGWALGAHRKGGRQSYFWYRPCLSCATARTKSELKECCVEAKWPVGFEEVNITKSNWRDERQVAHKESASGTWTSADEKDLRDCMPEVWYNLYTTLKAERGL